MRTTQPMGIFPINQPLKKDHCRLEGIPWFQKSGFNSSFDKPTNDLTKQKTNNSSSLQNYINDNAQIPTDTFPFLEAPSIDLISFEETVLGPGEPVVTRNTPWSAQNDEKEFSPESHSPNQRPMRSESDTGVNRDFQPSSFEVRRQGAGQKVNSVFDSFPTQISLETFNQVSPPAFKEDIQNRFN